MMGELKCELMAELDADMGVQFDPNVNVGG